jgi:hypothetical protein
MSEARLRRLASAVARGAGIAGVIAVAACSSGGGNSARNTATSARIADASNVPAFFAHDGRPLLAFERATAPLATGTVVQRQTCVALRQALPKIVADPNSLIPLAQRVPNATLASVLAQDVKLRLFVISGCSSLDGPVTAYPEIRDSADVLERLFREYGIGV